MSQIELSDAQMSIIETALRVASSQYDMDAQMCERRGEYRLAEQFAKQASEALDLADALEKGDL